MSGYCHLVEKAELELVVLEQAEWEMEVLGVHHHHLLVPFQHQSNRPKHL